MSIPGPLASRLRRLRWKLTLTYTGVTVSALLVVELLFILASGSFLVNLLDRSYLPPRVIQAARMDYIPVLRFYLERSPPDQEGITMWLERFNTSATLLQGTGGIPVVINPGELDMLLVGRDGDFLGASSPDLAESGAIGHPFDTEAVPGLTELLQTALAGEKGPERLYTFTHEDTKLVMAVPIPDSADQQVLGVLVISALVPTLSTVLGDSLPTIGVSLVVFTLFAGLIGTLFGFLAARGLERRFERLSEASLAWSQGDFNVIVDDRAGDELSTLAHRLNQMAGQLQNLLETRRELVAVEERNRLARELHDSVKQQAFAAAAQINAARTLLKHDPKGAEAHIEEAEHLTYDLRRELTNLIQQLRPVALDEKSLTPAVKAYAEDWSRQNGIPVEVRAQRERPLALEIERAVFRVVQEALANIARHSQANNVEIELIYNKASLTCRIGDDGVGFDSGKVRTGFGLRSMQERAGSLGGNLTYESLPGKGTSVTLTVPLREPT